MNILKKLPAHIAILIGNMYYVFWGIDRVNRSMNFIDNGYTKLLILILILCCCAFCWPLLKNALARLRRAKDPAPIYARLALLGLNALLGAVILILLAVDLFNEDRMLFLNGFVKALILILCVTALLNALQSIARDRAAERILARRAAQHPARQPARQPAPPRQPVRPRTSAGYGSNRPAARTPPVRRANPANSNPPPARTSAGSSRSPAPRPSERRPSLSRSVSLPTRSNDFRSR